eukprot:4225777-Amphidinium_carterae.1
MKNYNPEQKHLTGVCFNGTRHSPCNSKGLDMDIISGLANDKQTVQRKEKEHLTKRIDKHVGSELPGMLKEVCGTSVKLTHMSVELNPMSTTVP